MLRQLLHGLVAVLLWVVFVYYWWIVLRRPMNPDTRTALTILAILTLASIFCLALWIYHNIRIHRRFHRRKERRSVSIEIKGDSLGRRIVVDDPYAIQHSNYVEVEVRRSVVSGQPIEQKVFRVRV